MKVCTLLVLVTAIASYAQAQPTYMKIFRATGTAQANLNELASGNLFAGMARQSGTSLIDAEGDILQSHNYAVDTFLVLQSVKRFTDNEFYFVGNYKKDSCSIDGMNYLTINPAIGKMDSLGNVLSLNHYVLNGSCANLAGDLEVSSAGNALAWGTEAWFFALKTNTNGGVAWARNFNHHGGFRFIKELPGGDLLAGINMDTAGVVVARMDADGNFIWCRSYMRPTGMVADCLVESDESFVITGFTDSIMSTNSSTPLPSTYHPKLFMMRLNGAGDVLWCKGYDSEPNRWYTRGGTRIVKANDGDYVLLANLGIENYNIGFRPFVMRTDGNGDTLWTHSNGKTNYTYETRNLLAYSDGGFLYNGRIFGDLPEGQGSFAFLSKTDSLGHLPCYERWHPIVISDLFPTDSSFTLTSIDGATALPAFVNDTIYPPITLYDGCTFTTGIPSIARYSPSKTRVRPNPNAGRFTVQFADPLMAESYYSVYDAMGKLLYQRPLPTGKETEEIDLSRFGSGTYVIKFTDPKGTCYERVVVE